MSHFKPSMLTLALAAAGCCSMAHANEADATAGAQDEKVEVITVKGIRGSMARSQQLKMENSSIVEAISAEEIGKLPDVSIAESLARLPGLAAQRLDGRANVVSIRGLAPDFTTATLNGREQVTIGDNRGVEFDQYPSELINGVVVYKTPDATVTAQALGGTIDLQTIRPLAFGEQAFTVNLRGEQNDLGKLNPDGKDTGYRGSISYVDQFADDTVGIAIGYAKLYSPNQEERWNAWGYPNLDYNEDNPLVLGGAKPYVRSSLLERDGVMGVIEFQPNDQFRSMLDVYYAKFNDTQILRGTEIPGQWGAGWANDGIGNAVTENGLVTSGTILNSKVLVRNDVNRREADTFSIGWNNSYEFNANWNAEIDLAYSKADRKDWGLETYAGTSRGAGCTPGGCEDLPFQMNGERGATFMPGINYADPSLVQLGGPFNWGNNVTVPGDAQDGFINTPEIKDELKAVRASVQRIIDNGPIASVKVGVNYTERDKSKEDRGFFLTLKDYPAQTPVPSQFLLNPTSLGFIGMGNILSYDALGLYNSGFYTETSEGLTVASRATNSWGVKEKATTAFAMANIDTSLAERMLTGNFGLQMVRTEQSSTGFAVTQNDDGTVSLQPSTGGDTFTEWLPSLNLSYEVADSQMLRFATARTMSRPRMDQMNAGLNLSYDPSLAGSVDIENSPWSGDGGNPKLRPLMAWQFDLGYEYYLDGGYVAAGVFHKKLDSYIFSDGVLYDFSQFQVPDPQPELREGIVNVPANGKGGYVQGIELSGHFTGEMLTDSLQGFGVILSGSYTKSEVKETNDSEPTKLPGLSEKVANATLYYENYGFQGRVSARYRSDFLGEVTGLSLARTPVFVKAETVVDAQVGYDFSESGIDALYGLSVLFQVNNLTNEPFVTYQNEDARQIRDYQVYGRNYMLGFSYSL
ncbi:TonB-dependent receptor [Paraferrimonas sedimenticola]|uniref:TonB-dependent receptor n=1 Tax=Paraferrimonas sedimenticola TaxID=375674 RepID=A0AA37RV78_9GAMM|nr:TonB-dependent receptor [Paraferrimonas sedimenticola]GLP95854.1 TonB-dependent receptor [Paraferrimonas sedimenticola]